VALNNIDPGGLKQARINGVQSRDLLGLVVSQRVPVERNALGLPTKSCGVAPGGCVLARINVEFLRDTAHVDASTAQRGFLYHGYPRTKFRALARGAHAARACANDH